MSEEKKRTLLEVRNMSVSFSRYGKGLDKTALHVIRDLSVKVHEKEIVAVVGSSGSGKSLLAHGILGILPYNAHMEGEMLYRGETMTQQSREALRGKEIALVPQSLSYLDPLMKIGPHMLMGRKDSASRRRPLEMLRRYSLDEKVADMYTFELSGGMTRRVLISTALMDEPKLVIADEPTPGLDLAMAKRVMSHFRDVADNGAGVLLITHDLELALEEADRVVVFYAGMAVEDTPAANFRDESTLLHPYTRALWRAMPQNGFQTISITQPHAGERTGGCPFAPGCGFSLPMCRENVPYRQVRDGYVRCVKPISGGSPEM